MDPQFAATLMENPDYQPDGVATLLSIARQSISEGNPSLALQAIVTALKTLGGEGAVLHTLARARDVYRSRMNASAAADELASLFAECAIAEVLPSTNSGTPSMPNFQVELPLSTPAFPSLMGSTFGANGAESEMVANQAGAPILAESGRLQIVFDASSDGSSFICLQCGGLVSNLRRDEHVAYWCSHTP